MTEQRRQLISELRAADPVEVKIGRVRVPATVTKTKYLQTKNSPLGLNVHIIYEDGREHVVFEHTNPQQLFTTQMVEVSA